jgi:hypothetical protein
MYEFAPITTIEMSAIGNFFTWTFISAMIAKQNLIDAGITQIDVD